MKRIVRHVVLSTAILCATSLSLGGCKTTRGCSDLAIVKAPELNELRLKAESNPCVLLLIDPRPADSFERGHIPGARNLPLVSIAPGNNIKQRLSQFETIAVYEDNEQSVDARAVTKRLQAITQNQVLLFQSGFDNWKAAGLPISTGPGEPLPRSGFSKPNYTLD